ncbi:MAG: hypothetical protein ACRDI0_13085 [Actinomycetota bacterium]
MPERHTILGVYPDMDRAREAMTALERSGIEAAEISLEGEPAARAADDPVTAERDLRVTGHVGKRAITGLLVGSVIGAVIGAVAAGIATGGFGGPVMWAAAIGGGVAGGAVGGVMTGLATPAMSDDWELTHEPTSDGVRIRVTSEDPGEIERAEGILRGKDSITVERDPR